jgi:hypothetical protein
MFTTLLSSALLAGALSTGVQAAPVDERWFQARDSSVSALFEKRQTSPSDPSMSISTAGMDCQLTSQTSPLPTLQDGLHRPLTDYPKLGRINLLLSNYRMYQFPTRTTATQRIRTERPVATLVSVHSLTNVLSRTTSTFLQTEYGL